MKLRDRKVLVTGSDGFIGSHLVESLLDEGCEVRAFIYYNSFNSWGWLDTFPEEKKRKIEVFAGDVRDPNGVREAIKGSHVVFHLAALIGIPFSYHSPDSYIDTNVRGTLNVLQACREYNVERIIVTSTSEVYGTAKYVPIDEEHPLQGQSPYSASKIGADKIAEAFHYSFGIPVATVRPFNTYGPRQSARAIIPTVITQIASGFRKIKLGSLHPTRDFNYVRDTVNGFIAVAQSDQAVGEVVNIGSNFEISIGETVRAISEVMSVHVDVESELQRIRPENSEVERLCADNSKARSLTGWVPLYGGIEGLRRGLKETVAWFTNAENLRRYKPGDYNI
jgi:NAD dependent epimerase/dehydratase